MSPLVSAIIPTYNRPEALRRALRSVDTQTYEDLEVIVVETPSPETPITADVAAIVEYPSTHITTEPDVGASRARNIGMEEASGEYIAFLDDDDEWLPEKTSRQVEQLETSPPNVAASVTGDVKIGPDGSERGRYIPSKPQDPIKYQLCWNIGSFSTLMIRSSVMDEIGYLDESLKRREDQDFLLRIAREFDFALVQKPLVRKHAGEDDQLGNDYCAAVEANDRFREKYGKLADHLGMRDELEGALEFTLGRSALKNSEYSKARRHFLNAIEHQPRDSGYYIHFFVALGGPITYRIGKELSRREIGRV